MSGHIRHGWHPFNREGALIGFADYLIEVRRLRADAQRWAATLPASRQQDLIGGVAISEDRLAALPPMPRWMLRLFGPPEPVIFADHPGHPLYQWPFGWLADDVSAPVTVPEPEAVARWASATEAWRAATPVYDWLQPDNPLPAAWSDAIESLSVKATWTVPPQAWRKRAAAPDAAQAGVQRLPDWLAALGARDRLVEIAALWPAIGTYWALLMDYEKTAEPPGERPMSALQRAVLNAEGNAAAWDLGARVCREGEAGDLSSLHGRSLGGPTALSGPTGSSLARALRQFAYFGRIPVIPLKGVSRAGAWPSDPRLLSSENEDRAVAAIWILRLSAPRDRAIASIVRAASDLSVRLHSVHVGGLRERSWRGTKAAITALAELGAWAELTALAPNLIDPRLRRHAARAMMSDPRSALA